MFKTLPTMSHTTTPSWTTLGKGNALNLNTPEEEMELKVTSLVINNVTDHLKSLTNEFRGLHEQRLTFLDMDASINREDVQQKKVDLLQCYVNDLTDQNQVLIQTIEDLQNETHPKFGLKQNLSTSNGSAEELKPLSVDELVGATAQKPHSCCSLADITGKLEDLKDQLQTKDIVIYDLEMKLGDNLEQSKKEATLLAESSEWLVHLRTKLSCLQQIQKDNIKEIAEKDICITKLKANIEMLQQGEADKDTQLEVCRKQVLQQSRELSEFQHKEETLLIQMKAQEERVKHLDQDVVGLQTTQDSLKRTLAMKEKHTQQLARDNAQLKESLSALQSKLQVSECTVSDISKSLDKAQSGVEKERLEKQQVEAQLLSTKKEVECLQQELTHLCLRSEKKIQKREIKICALVKDLTASKRQQSDCQTQLLSKDKALDKLCEERDELKAKMDDQHREGIHLNHTKERLEADLALSHEKLHTSYLEVKSRDQLILQLRGEMKTGEQKHQTALEQMEALEDEVRRLNQRVKGHQEEACQLSEKVETSEEKLKKQWREIEHLHQQLKETKAQMREASLQAQSKNETTVAFKQKYTAAMEKVHRVQGQVDVLEEELRYSKQQLKESQVAKQSVKTELVEMEQRYLEKVGQWENSQEALDQLTDELQSFQNLLRESQQKMEEQKRLIGSLQDQVDILKQQKLETESESKHYRQSHSYSDDEYFSQLQQKQQLQKRCTEQVEHLAECEKAILQMKSELKRQAQGKTDLQKNLVVLQHGHLTSRRQEAARLKKEVTRLELELADAQKVHVSLLRSEGDLREARHEAERKSREVLSLQEELQKEEETKSNALREKRRLKAYIRQLSQELEELRSKHQVTVEELAARAEEAKRMEGCLNKEKLAEEKIRSVTLRLETEVTELKRKLEEAVDQKLKAEEEKQEAQDQVDSLRSELEVIRSDNSNLRHESQLVMTNVNQWLTQQKAANENIAVQMKAQSKVLRIVTEEKEHLQEANNTLKADLKRLKEVADEKERDMEHFKAQFQDHRCWRHDGTAEQETCIALNLCKIKDMQTRLRSNLEAVQKLNQQLNILSRENKHLHRQLEEERSLRRQVERLCLSPPTTVHPLPVSTSLPSYLHFPPPETKKADRFQSEESLSRLDRPVGSQVLGEVPWMRPTVERSTSLKEEAWKTRVNRIK